MKSELRKLIESRIKNRIHEYIAHVDRDEVEDIANSKAVPDWTEFVSEGNELDYAILSDVANRIGSYWRWADKQAFIAANDFVEKHKIEKKKKRIKWFEVEFSNGECIAIKGYQKPTVDEVKKFIGNDWKYFTNSAEEVIWPVNVLSISAKEAHYWYATKYHKEWKVFDRNKN